MFISTKASWAGLVFILVMTGISRPRPATLASAPNLSKEVPAVWHRAGVQTMQETLRDKGHYRGKINGVVGLRTRASVRVFQKAENLPATGQLDSQTAGKLGVIPEGHDKSGYQIIRGKPWAGTQGVKGPRRTGKIPRKAVAIVAGPETSRGDREKTLQAENEKKDR